MTTATKHPARTDSRHAEPPRANISDFIFEQARERPLQAAVIEQRTGRRVTFGELARRVENVAFGLAQLGIGDGSRALLAVKPGIDFVVTVFALFRAGAVPVVVDPGMGRKNLLACIEQARPQALVGIPLAHALSLRYRRVFGAPKRVTVGRRWFWGGATLRELERRNVSGSHAAPTTWSATAAILFTSGATGTPKGVVYHNGMFVEQVRMIRAAYDIRPGEIDVACFALFALFSVAMGVTIVLPNIDFSRPGKCDPAKIVDAIRESGATISFGSPAIWRKVGSYLLDNNLRLPTLRRVLIAGAAVPHATLGQLADRIAPGGEIHTPYGATESLPLSTIGSREVLAETRFDTQAGSGVCVGKPLPGVSVKVARIVDGPISTIGDMQELKAGEVGEILVRSAVTTQEYFGNEGANAQSKVRDGGDTQTQRWHRMGDTGYFDAKGRLWYCGRVAHTVWTAQGPLFPEQVEGLFCNHNAVARSALVGIGAKGAQEPVIIAELHGGTIPAADLRGRIETELLQMAQAHALTRQVKRALFHPAFPVDARHNAKIDREALARWVGKLLVSAPLRVTAVVVGG